MPRESTLEERLWDEDKYKPRSRQEREEEYTSGIIPRNISAMPAEDKARIRSGKGSLKGARIGGPDTYDHDAWREVQKIEDDLIAIAEETGVDVAYIHFIYGDLGEAISKIPGSEAEEMLSDFQEVPIEDSDSDLVKMQRKMAVAEKWHDRLVQEGHIKIDLTNPDTIAYFQKREARKRPEGTEEEIHDEYKVRGIGRGKKLAKRSPKEPKREK